LPSGDLEKKKLPDTILGRRTLIVPDPFNASRALRQLFPGKWYDLSTQYSGRLISWVCPSCKPKTYPDANPEYGDPPRFPYPGGVATRLITVFSYIDSNGKQNKLISFNHSDYDPDGLQTSRFSGGILGMAKFIRIGSSWQLQIFQPAIAAYGSFSQAPTPKPLLIGDDQYAYMIEHVNGGPGGPFREDDYLIAEVGNSYRQILFAYGAARDSGGDSVSAWTRTYSIRPGKKRFRDIVFVCRGLYWANDPEGLPEELKGKLKASKQGNFRITHVFSYSDRDGYMDRVRAKVWIQPVKIN
jgi:hypothetical protein